MVKRALKKLFSVLGLQVSFVKGNSVEDKFAVGDFTKNEWLRDLKISTIIDVGANEGQFAEKVLTIFPNSKIFCFEPIKSVFETIRSNFAGKSNVVVFNYGLGESDEEKLIHLNEYSPSSSILNMLDTHKKNFDFAVKTEPQAIQIRRLDDFFHGPIESPVLLKIDVQGYEMNVLKGGEDVVRQSDVVLIETTFIPLYDGQPLFAEIYDYLVLRGFQYAGNIEQLISPKTGQILQADAIFIKSIGG